MLCFGAKLPGFATMGGSASTLLSSLLGDFEFEEMRSANPFLGPVFFILFMLIGVFVMLNMFIAIISDAYMETKHELEQEPEMDAQLMAEHVRAYIVEGFLYRIPIAGSVIRQVHQRSMQASRKIAEKAHEVAEKAREVAELAASAAGAAGAAAGGLQGARKHVQDEEEALEAAAIAKMQRRGRSARDTSMKLALAPTAGSGPRKPNALRIEEGFDKFDHDGSGDIDIEELERHFNAATSTSMMRDMDTDLHGRAKDDKISKSEWTAYFTGLGPGLEMALTVLDSVVVVAAPGAGPEAPVLSEQPEVKDAPKVEVKVEVEVEHKGTLVGQPPGSPAPISLLLSAVKGPSGAGTGGCCLRPVMAAGKAAARLPSTLPCQAQQPLSLPPVKPWAAGGGGGTGAAAARPCAQPAAALGGAAAAKAAEPEADPEAKHEAKEAEEAAVAGGAHCGEGQRVAGAGTTDVVERRLEALEKQNALAAADRSLLLQMTKQILGQAAWLQVADKAAKQTGACVGGPQLLDGGADAEVGISEV
jgi:hypothetical protein